VQKLWTNVDLSGQWVIKSLDQLDPNDSYQYNAHVSAPSTYTVLFPEPLAPTRAIYVPFSTLSDKSRKTRTPGRVGYRKCKPSMRIRPCMPSESGFLPAVDSASISGTMSSNLMISEPAPLAEDTSGTKEKTLPA
jgi:hypothetical protein